MVLEMRVESRLRSRQYEWSTACRDCWRPINGVANAVHVRLKITVRFLRPLERRTLVIRARNAVRSSRKLSALDVHQGG